MPAPTLSSLNTKKRYPKSLKIPYYLDVYQRHIGHLRNKPVRILEVGIASGDSLRLWRDYFPKGKIVGLDANPRFVAKNYGERIVTALANQSSIEQLTLAAQDHAPYDFIVDDGAHTGLSCLNSFIALFPLLKPGAIYAIEDWGTGYWKHWPDGAQIADNGNFRMDGHRFLSHEYGMVGVIKQLIDVLNIVDRTKGKQCSSIESMEIFPGLVILRKRSSNTSLINKKQKS